MIDLLISFELFNNLKSINLYWYILNMSDGPTVEERDSDDETRHYPEYPPLREDKTSKSNVPADVPLHKRRALPDVGMVG